MSRQFVENVIAEARIDEVGLWWFVKEATVTLGMKEPDDIRGAALHGVRQVLANGDIVAASYADNECGYDVWGGTVDEIVAGIEKVWDELGREPDIGDIVVFIDRELANKPRWS